MVRGRAGQLKYEFRVRPGARLADIRLAYDGAAGLVLDDAGGLLIETALGVLRDSPPVAYQEIAGARVPVQSRYALKADGAEREYGFAVGAGYESDRELIMDPGVDYSTLLGGTSLDSAVGIAIDSSGNAYVVGVTQSIDFPTTSGAFDRTLAGPSNPPDVFVSKLNSSGTGLIYSTYFGGGSFEFGRAIAIDAAGNAYVTGQTTSRDFPTTGGAFITQPPQPPPLGSPNDAFVTKLNATGSALVYSTFLGGGEDIDDGLGIAVDGAGNAYVTGETGSSDFPTTAGAFDRTKNGAFDAFVTKLNPTGSAPVFSTYLGGLEVDYGRRVALDAAGNACVMGPTRSADFPTTPGAFDTTPNGAFDVFVLKLNAAGSGLVYSTRLGGLDSDSGDGLALDATGNAYVAGGTLSPDFPTTPGAFDTLLDGSDAFVAKLNAAGSALVFSTFLGGTGPENGRDLALDPAGNIYVAGETLSPDFPTTAAAFDRLFDGNPLIFWGDAFVTKFGQGTNPPPPPPPPSTPTLLAPANDARPAQPVLFDWSDVSAAASYELQIGSSSSFPLPLTAGAMTTVSQASIGGLPASRLFWRVRGINSAGVAGPFSAVRRFTPQAAPGAPALSTLALNPTSVVGGNAGGGTLTLTSAAPSGGLLVTLSSSNAAVAGVPASATVAAGATSASFTLTTTSVTASTPVTITAMQGSVSRTASLTVAPPSTGPLPAPALVSPAADANFSPGQTIVFDWSDVPLAASYTLVIDDSDTFGSPITTQTLGASTFSTSTLPTTRLWFRVRANDAAGAPGAWSSARRFEVK